MAGAENRSKIPLIVLGGSDRKPARLPPRGENQHPLYGCKGADIRIEGRSLIHHLIERLRASGGFGPIWVAGPATAYREVEPPVEVIDTDGGFGENIQTALETVLKRHGRGEVAFTTCDILPEVAELEELLLDYWQGTPSDLWYPVICTGDPADLGVSEWKPRYRIVPREGEEAKTVLPGHLIVVDASSLRLHFLYRLFDLGYRTRNRPIRFRRSYMLRQVLWGLLRQDLLHILGLRLPTVTWDVVRHGAGAANRLRKGVLTRRELEDAVRHVFVARRHRRAYPERRVRIPFMNALSIARDIDTEEEAQAIGASYA